MIIREQPHYVTQTDGVQAVRLASLLYSLTFISYDNFFMRILAYF